MVYQETVAVVMQEKEKRNRATMKAEERLREGVEISAVVVVMWEWVRVYLSSECPALFRSQPAGLHTDVLQRTEGRREGI